MHKIVVLGFFLLVTCLAASAWSKIGGGNINYKMSGAGDVLFTHESHVGRLGQKCSECHYRIYTTVEQHNKTTMAEMQRGRSCGACHDGKKAFDVKANCERCHAK